MIYLLLSSVNISLRNVYFGFVEGSEFTGFSNYYKILKTPRFWGAMRFSLIFGCVTTLLELVTGFALAYFYYSKFKGNKLVFTLLITPMLMAPSLFGLMNRILFNNFIGLIPGYLRFLFGIDIDFFSPRNIVLTLISIDVLQWTPFTFLVFYAALLSIPPQLIEAASIDGAKRSHVLWYVVLPYVTPALVTGGFLRFLESFRVFDTIYVLTGGGPGYLTTSISIFIYRTGFTMGDQSSSSAAGMILFAFMMIPAIIFAKMMKRRW
ncbi:carbohydrate ABC transporter permease [Pseudothermotoga sp.]